MKDPKFSFYPGEYLRDTQTLSANAQVAYDRIMCEHMRNICEDMSKIGLSQQQLKFFIRKLNKEEVEELMHTLTEIDGIYQIQWVAVSICKSRIYAESRRNNRKGNGAEDMKTYVDHIELTTKNAPIYNNNIDNTSNIIDTNTTYSSTQKKEKKSKIFAKPTLDELVAFKKEIGGTSDPQDFIDYYDSNGWKVGRNPMKDWKATYRRWQRTNNSFAPSASPKSTQQPSMSFDQDRTLMVKRNTVAQ